MADRFDYLDDAHPLAARYARRCILAAEKFGVGSRQHERAKRKLLKVVDRILRETDHG